VTYGQDVRTSVVDDCVYSKGSLIVSVAGLAADQDLTFVVDLYCQPEVYIYCNVRKWGIPRAGRKPGYRRKRRGMGLPRSNRA